ncbi:MAG: DMT family transporter [Erysipelotrichaceae bacterium]|nr:DMT family transporter [Erysipelotrichaceae bacterium]
MNFKKLKGPFLLLITAFLWGTTFVAQSLGSDHVGAFTYNAGRFITTGIILLIISLIRKRKVKEYIPTNKNVKWILVMSIFVGVALFLGATFQQLGINITKSPSKSGFISSLYMMFVPIIGYFIKKKPRAIIWLYLVIAIIGSYMISINGELKLELGDILTLICAVMFAVQIVLVDIINPHIDSIKLSAIQFIVAGILSIIFMLFTETINFNDIYKALPAIMYAAIFSGCIAFTLQIVAQKSTEPTIASMIMSLESVFALISGVVILKEELTPKLIIGCSLIFIAVICAQIDFKKVFKK